MAANLRTHPSRRGETKHENLLSTLALGITVAFPANTHSTGDHGHDEKILGSFFDRAWHGGGGAGDPSHGIVSNVILAMGTTLDALSEEVFVDGNVDGDDNAQHGNHWQVRLATSGVSNFYVQDATIAPGGYTGWHTHPGVLLVTVAAGSVDWYDANCGLHHYNTGDSFTENNEPHDVVNSGTENARLLAAYITKQGAARRAESDAPACAVALGLP